VRAEGIRSGLAAPIVVDRELCDHRRVIRSALPSDTAAAADFTDLIATAIANTQLTSSWRPADEQAALRRVATWLRKVSHRPSFSRRSPRRWPVCSRAWSLRW
jgi:hypothetical protein